MTARLDPSLIPPSPDLSFEIALWQAGVELVAGLDEAGRGAWAGPVCAAAVVFPFKFNPSITLNRVRDSKQLSPLERATLAPLIRDQAYAWGVGLASSREIDALGILPATRLAMTRALEALALSPAHLLLDALFLPDLAIPQTSLYKGDQRSLSIAAASILAKTTRDEWMTHYAEQEPHYGFARHKGYGTRVHRAALSQYGPCPQHRFSFSPLHTHQPAKEDAG